MATTSSEVHDPRGSAKGKKALTDSTVLTPVDDGNGPAAPGNGAHGDNVVPMTKGDGSAPPEQPEGIMGEAAAESTTTDPYANLLAESVESPDDFGAGPAVPGAIIVRKPLDGEFVRCHPTFAPLFHVYLNLITRRSFLVYRQFVPLLGIKAVRLHTMRMFVTPQMVHFIWAMPMGIVDSDLSMTYARSRDTVAAETIQRWMSCTQARGLWSTAPPGAPEIFPEPEWPPGDGNSWLAAAWRGAIIDRADHDEILIRRGVKLA
jgi:hypothetical protein